MSPNIELEVIGIGLVSGRQGRQAQGGGPGWKGGGRCHGEAIALCCPQPVRDRFRWAGAGMVDVEAGEVWQ